MKFKSLLCTIALGALAFAACEKPDTPGTETPGPEVAGPKFGELTVNQGTSTTTLLNISGPVTEFEFVDNETTPVGVWVANGKDGKKFEFAGEFVAEGAIIKGKATELEYNKPYFIGIFAKVDGKTYYSEGVEKTLEEPAPVKFPVVAVKGDKNKMSISSKLKDAATDEAIAADKVEEAGVWCLKEGETAKKEVVGAYNAETTLITGTIENLELGVKYTAGTYVKMGGKKWYSEGLSKTLTNEVNLNESTVAIEDKNNFYTNGGNKSIKITIDETTYNGIRIGANKKGTMEFNKAGSMKLDNKQMKVTGNVTVEFYAFASGADEPLVVTLEGTEGAKMTTDALTIKAKEGYDGGDWTGAPTAADHYKMTFTGVDEKTMIKLECKEHVIAFWGIRVSETK